MDWIHQREPRVGAAALSSVAEAAGRGAARRGEEEGGGGCTGESRRGRGAHRRGRRRRLGDAPTRDSTSRARLRDCASQDSGVRSQEAAAQVVEKDG